MSGFVNEFMNELIIGLLIFPPVASVLFIVALTRAPRYKVNSK
jgi:hypothetical protein